jgi:phosphotransferase system HPr-like phosphotransfer protein
MTHARPSWEFAAKEFSCEITLPSLTKKNLLKIGIFPMCTLTRDFARGFQNSLKF